MKKLIFNLVFYIILPHALMAQSVLLTPDSSKPQATITGNLYIKPSTTAFTNAGAIPEILVPSSGNNGFYLDYTLGQNELYLSDAAGTNNYISGMNGYTYISSAYVFEGLRITFLDFDTEADGDSIKIYKNLGTRGEINKTFSGSNIPESLDIFSNEIAIYFFSDNDTNVGRGFRIKIQGIRYMRSASLPILHENFLYFDASKGSLITNSSSVIQNVSYRSTALGGSSASGNYSTAMGYQSTASGDFSTAIGKEISTNSKRGAFVIGDSSPYDLGNPTFLQADVADKFFARFYNGYYLKTGSSSGVHMIHNDNSWRSISDSTKKENFEPIDFENILEKASKLRATTWNYKGQNPKQYRHYGPMAQEFYAAFGKDKLGIIGNDTTLSAADVDGVNLALIQALEKRTKALQEENQQLRKQVENLLSLKSRVERMEAMLNKEYYVIKSEN